MKTITLAVAMAGLVLTTPALAQESRSWPMGSAGLNGPDVSGVEFASFCNPNPEAGDVFVPLPGGGEMAFRKIVTPGPNVWGGEGRTVHMGRSDSDMFESPPKRMSVDGGFYDEEAGNWIYYLGKYEVSKGQVALILGDGDLGRGIAMLARMTGDSRDRELLGLSGRQLEFALSEPAASLSVDDIDRVIRTYNRWIARGEDLWKELPSQDGEPGFLRLPTELEWEYAAAGGAEGVAAGVDLQRYPFPAADYDDYAIVSENARGKTASIGIKQPAYGLYDMVGNVAEIVDGRFYTDLWQGRPGASIARGGHFGISHRSASGGARMSLREEFSRYKIDEDGKFSETRSPFYGFRLAIGTNAATTSQSRRRLEADYAAYVAGIRSRLPIGRAENAVVGSIGNVDDLAAELESLQSRASEQEGVIELKDGEIERIRAQLQDTKSALSDYAVRAAIAEAKSALINLSLFRETIRRIAGLNEARAQLESLIETSPVIRDEYDAYGRQIDEERDYLSELAQAYHDDVQAFASFDVYAEPALDRLESDWTDAGRFDWALPFFREDVGNARDLTPERVYNELVARLE